MLRRQKQIRAQIQKLLDAALFAFAFWLAHSLLDTGLKVYFFGGAPIERFSDYLWLLLVIIPVSPFLLERQGFYNRPSVASWKTFCWQLFKATSLTVIVVISAMFLGKEILARSVIIFFGVISFILVLIKEELIRLWVRTRFGRAQMIKRVILVGAPEDTARVMAELHLNPSPGIEILERVNLNETSVDQLVELLHTHSANGVMLTAKHTYFGQIEKAIQACEIEGVEAWLLADFFNTQVSQTSLDEFNGRPTLVFRSTPEESWQHLVKLIVDVTGAAVLLVISSPFWIFATLAIRLRSPGPVLFKQERAGLNGKPFTMLKFRSMVTDAEQRKRELEVLNEMTGPVFKVSDDPRITPIGRILRKYSIDELPQLYNVLRGEMSLVGPRPLPLDEVRRFDDLAHRRRLSVKPGLTCLWQVSGRNQVTDFRDWVRLDLEYIDNWSLWLDFKILVRTVPVVILGTGAK
ncbi:MAG: exopolysaccharide biosynthesis polyprenyl glycosylphosphotransferase [Verrucomicrobiales bacterium]|nr:exopolysaccharide biosynthesis polyprenyl glycosylphosphotransferase [Verrucomicrobiales bacterium]